jgi:glycosyltransferase involved in cell wall biosynthesis
MGKAAIYNPYLDTLGGGEKYTLSFAKVLAEEYGYSVFVEWPSENIREKLINRFGFKLPANINFIKSINRGDGHDLCFWVSDGSIPTLRARKNIIHFQVPFHDVDGKSLLNKMKLFRVNKIICNSEFTKKTIDKEYGVNSKVLYPPIDVRLFKPKRKENQICYVGRFSNLVQNKGHEILIKSFKKLVTNKKFINWKLILAGGVEVGVADYVKKLKNLSMNYDIEIIESPDFDKIREIYGKSKFFWSATGFGVDEIKNPEKVEHFGITLIESMASGCVPIVHGSGGFKEIIDNSKNGFLWNNLNDLVNLTKQIIDKPLRLREMSIAAQQKSKSYSYEKFKSRIKDII